MFALVLIDCRPLENLPKLDFNLGRLGRASQRIAKMAKRTLIAAEANLSSRFNVDSIPEANRARGRDAYSMESNAD
jgi:hypothetical protein